RRGASPSPRRTLRTTPTRWCDCAIEFSASDLGTTDEYRRRSMEVGAELVERGKGIIVSEATGVNSLTVACPHGWVSVTHAAEKGARPGHVERHDFYNRYKALGAQYRKAKRRGDE